MSSTFSGILQLFSFVKFEAAQLAAAAVLSAAERRALRASTHAHTRVGARAERACAATGAARLATRRACTLVLACSRSRHIVANHGALCVLAERGARPKAAGVARSAPVRCLASLLAAYKHAARAVPLLPTVSPCPVGPRDDDD